MVQQVTVWVDSKGNYYGTEEEAIAADKKHSESKELKDIANALKKHAKNGFPQTLLECAVIARDAYPDLKKVLEK